MNKKTIAVTETTQQMVTDIRESLGLLHDAEVYRLAIAEKHQSLFPKYLSGSKVSKRGRPTKDDSGETQESKKKAEQNEKERAMRSICGELGGEVIEENGSKKCVYRTWNYENSYEKKIDLENLNQSLLENQFSPSKEKVEERLTAKGIDIPWKS